MKTQIYQINDIPDRDKDLLRPYQNKAEYINAFPKMMSDHANEYDLYFTTFTFAGLKSNIAYSYYHEFFRYFRQKLDNALLSNSQAHKKAPFFFMFPEANPQTHFHGILFLHKNTSQKFQNKCVLNIESEYSEKLSEHVSSIRLKSKFINPYPKAIIDKNIQSKMIHQKCFKDRTSFQKTMLHADNKTLAVADYRIYPLSSPEQQMRSFNYSIKSFISSYFTIDNIIVESKARPQKA